VDARRRLAESEERLALALESSRMGVWDWDVRSGRVLYTLPPGVVWPENPAARADRPVLPEYGELHASEWNVNTHPDDVLLWRGAVEAAVAGVTSMFTTVYRRRTPLGDWIWIEARGKVVARDRRGRATRLVGTFENVTEGMHEETRRRRLEISLLQATRLTAIAEVASGLSHELNQPLSVAMSHVQAAARMVRNGQPDTAALQKLLADAVAFVERAGEIVRRYRCLASSRLAERETFDIAESARQIAAMLAPDARRDGVSVKMVDPAPARLVVADRVQIEQVLVNLVRNGIEAAVASDRRPRQVVVSVDAADRAVHVRVSDTGGGIPESLREAIFTPFFTTKAEGTGLGLPLSRTIAEAHGGRLALECGDPGRTSFVLTLP
jgi:C4-dicarboxylate-specific signal transduction histidine kinase